MGTSLFCDGFVDDFGLSHLQFRLVYHLARRGSCYASIRSISEFLKTGHNQIRRELKFLKKHGIVSEEIRKGQTSVWRVNSFEKWLPIQDKPLPKSGKGYPDQVVPTEGTTPYPERVGHPYPERVGHPYPERVPKVSPKEVPPIKYSDTNVSANGDADSLQNFDITKIIFQNGLAYLMSHGVKEKHARSLLGKWRKDHADSIVIEALAKASKESVVDPPGYIQAILSKKSAHVPYGAAM